MIHLRQENLLLRSLGSRSVPFTLRLPCCSSGCGECALLVCIRNYMVEQFVSHGYALFFVQFDDSHRVSSTVLLLVRSIDWLNDYWLIDWLMDQLIDCLFDWSTDWLIHRSLRAKSPRSAVRAFQEVHYAMFFSCVLICQYHRRKTIYPLSEPRGDSWIRMFQSGQLFNLSWVISCLLLLAILEVVYQVSCSVPEWKNIINILL